MSREVPNEHDKTKPLLLGMNNPLSDDPHYDLFPYPEHSTGWRLWKMLPEGTTRAEYMNAFDRVNVLRSREWSALEARSSADKMMPDLDGRFVIVLGSEVRAALRLDPAEPLSVNMHFRSEVAFAWLAFPHPSGRNAWFNSKQNYQQARDVLRAAMEGSFPGVG